MSLAYPPFASCPRIVLAHRNAPPLRRGDRGAGVRVLQAGLVQLGYPLPKSMVGSVPDGDYGQETESAVSAFQKKNALKPDGVCGRNTVSAMDGALFAPLPPPPPPEPKLLTSAPYKLGVDDPPHRRDVGAGGWKSKRAELPYIALMASIDLGLSTFVAFGKDATNHLRHYFGNTGTLYTLDLEAMLREVPSARHALIHEASEAVRFVEQLSIGTHSVTSTQEDIGYNEEAESLNWYFAIGGYKRWGKGRAQVKLVNGRRHYTLDFVYKVRDRYNWDNGKEVTIPTPWSDGIVITDKFMGEFHRQGLAREYLCTAEVRRQLSWQQGAGLPRHLLLTPAGRA